MDLPPPPSYNSAWPNKKEGSFPPIVVCNMPDRKQSTGVLKQNSFAWAIKGPPIFVPSKKGAAGKEYSRRMLFLKSIIFNPLVQENSKINSTNFVFSQERYAILHQKTYKEMVSLVGKLCTVQLSFHEQSMLLVVAQNSDSKE